MLKALTEVFATAGFENEVRSIISNEIAPYVDKIDVDNMGNLIAFKKGITSAHTVVLSCHTDEAGFIVSHITDDGYLKFRPIASIPPETVISKRVKINDILGVISFKAIHLTTKQERENTFKFSDLLIDIGAKSRSDAEKYVKVGDMGGFYSEFKKIGEDFIKAKALDSRAGCAVIAELLKNEYNSDIYAVFAAHGKLENRGLSVAAKRLDADFAININAFDCGDGVKLGEGAALPTVFSNGVASEKMLEMLKNTAKKKNIKIQLCGAPERMGGCAEFKCSADIIIPIKGENSPANIMSKGDYNSCRELIDAFLQGIMD